MNEPLIPEYTDHDPKLDELVLASFQAWLRWKSGTGTKAAYDATVDAVAEYIALRDD